MTKAERRAQDEANDDHQSALAHLHGLDRAIGQLQDILEQIIEVREQTIRQANRDVIHQWRAERKPEEITGVIRTSWSEPNVLVDKS
jgi:hypothetical protein